MVQEVSDVLREWCGSWKKLYAVSTILYMYIHVLINIYIYSIYICTYKYIYTVYIYVLINIYTVYIYICTVDQLSLCDLIPLINLLFILIFAKLLMLNKQMG